MPSRTFTDERGTTWLVWAVEPTWRERRSGQQRRVVDLEDQELIERGGGDRDRRRGGDRRRASSDGSPRLRIASNMEGGWLAFEASAERRRLTPIPQGWFEASDAELLELLHKATVVPAPRRRLIE